MLRLTLAVLILFGPLISVESHMLLSMPRDGCLEHIYNSEIAEYVFCRMKDTNAVSRIDRQLHELTFIFQAFWARWSTISCEEIRSRSKMLTRYWIDSIDGPYDSGILREMDKNLSFMLDIVNETCSENRKNRREKRRSLIACLNDKDKFSCRGLADLTSLERTTHRHVFDPKSANNSLSSINLTQFDSLVDLDLSNNNLTDKSILLKDGEQFKVGSLDLSGNNLESLTILSSWQVITTLNLANNNIEVIRKTDFKTLPSIRELDLSSAGRKSFGPSNLTDQTPMSVLKFEDGVLDELSSLRFLNVSGNYIEWNENSFSRFNRGESALLELDLSATHIDRVPPIVKSAVKLRRLHLNRNLFRTLEASDFEGLNSLEYLGVSHCDRLISIDTLALDGLETLLVTNNKLFSDFKLSAISTSRCRGLNKLNLIDLSNNNLRVLTDELEWKLKKSEERYNPNPYPDFKPKLWARLDGNPWHCNCSIKWMADRSFSPGMRCASPSEFEGMELSYAFDRLDCHQP